MSEVLNHRQQSIDSIRRDYEYMDRNRYPTFLDNDSIFSTIARFTPLDDFGESDAFTNHFKVWCNSVGVWMVVEGSGSLKFVLAVRQSNKVDGSGKSVWEIPSGHTEPERDGDAFVSAARELEEETGIAVNPSSLLPLTVVRGKDPYKGALLFRSSIGLSRLRDVIGNPVGNEGQTQIFKPPSIVDEDEIGAIALIPTKLSFRGSSCLPHSLLERSAYKDVTQRGYSTLCVTKFNAGDYF